MLEQRQSKSEACPIVPVLQNFQAVAIEVDLAIKEHTIEGLIRNLVVSAILGLILGILECEVVLNWAAWELGLLVLAGTEGRCQIPETDQDRDCCEEAEEDAGLQSSTDLP